MPRRSTLAKLPPPVRSELHKRLLAADFGDTVQIAAWLSSKGYAIGKTAVSAYSNAHKAAIQTDAKQAATLGTPVGRQVTDIRLRCLEAAAQSGPGKTVQARAANFCAWVLEK